MWSKGSLGLGIPFIAFSSLPPSLAPGSDAGHARLSAEFCPSCVSCLSHSHSIFSHSLFFLKLRKQLEFCCSFSSCLFLKLLKLPLPDLTISKARCTRRLGQRTSATQYQAGREGGREKERDRQRKILRAGMSREEWGSCRSEEKE